MSNKKLVVAIPTRNNANGIKVLLDNTLSLYKDFDIDIALFDSSDNDETSDVASLYMNNFDNLYYQKFDSNFSLADKMDAILSCKYFKNEYKYIWPIKDRKYVDDKSLRAILNEIDNEPDAILLFPGYCPQKIYTKPEEIYRDFCSCITSLEVMIYSYDKILKTYSFDDYLDTRHDKFLSWWSPYLYAMHKLSKISDLHVHVIDANSLTLHEIDGLKMTWSKDIFEIWVEYWIKINDELPDCYSPYKDACIKMAPSLPVILGSREKLIELYHEGILTKEKYEKYKDCWHRVSDIPAEVLRKIVTETYDINHDFSIYTSSGLEMLELVEKFISLLDAGKIQTNVIPLDNIINSISTLVHTKYDNFTEMKYLILGSINDLYAMMTTTSDSVKYKEYLQILMNYYIMIIN